MLIYSKKVQSNFTFSNILTVTRIIFAPILAILIIKKSWLYAFLIFFFSALTDLFDGYTARLLNQETVLGAYLDPIADKLLLLSCYFTIPFIENGPFQVPLWLFFFVLFKEIILISGACYCYLLKRKKIVPTFFAKLSTALQLIFLGYIFSYMVFKFKLPIPAEFFLFSVMTLNFFTIISYAKKVFYPSSNN